MNDIIIHTVPYSPILKGKIELYLQLSFRTKYNCQISSRLSVMMPKETLKCFALKPLGAMYIYICTRAPTAHCDMCIYMHTIQTSAYHAELSS